MCLQFDFFMLPLTSCKTKRAKWVTRPFCVCFNFFKCVLQALNKNTMSFTLYMQCILKDCRLGPMIMIISIFASFQICWPLHYTFMGHRKSCDCMLFALVLLLWYFVPNTLFVFICVRSSESISQQHIF